MSIAPTDKSSGAKTLTLGELLYAAPAMTLVSEKEWLAAVRGIAAGDQAALRLLYEKAFPVVFTYLIRLTGDRYLTDRLILEVFQMVWCEAPVFDSADGPVLGWIMRHARTLALNNAGGGKSSPGNSDQVAMGTSTDPVPIGDGSHRSLAGPPLERALGALTMDERQAIEATFLNGMSYAELAAENGHPIGTIKSRIRSGLAKLQQALHARGEER